jgi:hypothetical protein
MMLGAQASPPARIAINQLSCINALLMLGVSYVPQTGLRETRAGGDACAPSIMVSDYFHGSYRI